MLFRSTYAAEEGNNDDLVMGLVLFSWLSAQTYFRDSTNMDIRKLLVQEQDTWNEENMVPVGIVDDGLKEEVIKDPQNNDIWTEKGYLTTNF